VLLFKEKDGNKREALLAEELGSLDSNSNIFGFCFFREQFARTNTIFKPK
jgi:hypothetical protein